MIFWHDLGLHDEKWRLFSESDGNPPRNINNSESILRSTDAKPAPAKSLEIDCDTKNRRGHTNVLETPFLVMETRMKRSA
jgi:hypothetical protein